MSDWHLQQQRLFEEALKRSSDAERAALLDDSCQGSPELRARIELLLEGHFKSESFLEVPPDSTESLDDEIIGTEIGRYRLLEKIGEGGFGVVYLAEQTEPVKRRVALKIIKLGMDTKQVVARFEAERQALALMDHPNIAKVFDGGAIGDGDSQLSTLDSQLLLGRPYFVMELVRGVPITKYCEKNELPLHERLGLFVQVCQAVQHAHQKGIIHRDLKPSNLLVTVNDGVAVPKVIDFGVAKATQQELTDRTIITQFHHFIGTPAYMSPEQAEMTSVDIDTRSDIYSLGVLLYELLTGKTPFDGRELLASGLDEMRRIIREKEPLKPSTRLRQGRGTAKRNNVESGEKGKESGELPGSNSTLKSPLKPLSTDLDWIVLKCLEKDRARRYATANGLAADIQRHLSDEPVVARPPSASYRFQKFVRRNKLQFVAGSFVVIVLLLAVVISGWQALRANRERAQAERRLQRAVRLMSVTFEKASPALSAFIGTTKVRGDLALAAAGIVEDLKTDPAPGPEVRRLLADYYLQLSYVQAWLGFGGNTTGEFEEGLRSAQQAMSYLLPTGSEAIDDFHLGKLARAEMSASFASSGLLRFDKALEHLSRTQYWAELLSRSTNSDSASYGQLLGCYARQLTAEALIRAGRSEEALRKLGDSLNGLRQQVVQPELASQDDLWKLHGEFDLLGAAHLKLGKKEEAARYWRESLALAEVEYRRWPHMMQFASAVAEARAQLGEVLLSVSSTNEALPLLAAGLKQVDSLRQIDPENAGLVLLEARVLGSHARGYIAWAAKGSDPIAERLRRLEKAEAYLQQAEAGVARLESESLRKFLRYDLNQITLQLQDAKASIESGTPPSAAAPAIETPARQ